MPKKQLAVPWLGPVGEQLSGSGREKDASVPVGGHIDILTGGCMKKAGYQIMLYNSATNSVEHDNGEVWFLAGRQFGTTRDKFDDQLLTGRNDGRQVEINISRRMPVMNHRL
jgi:hypothetical protein